MLSALPEQILQRPLVLFCKGSRNSELSQRGFLATYLIYGCVRKGVELGSESLSVVAAVIAVAAGVRNSGSLESNIFKKSRNLNPCLGRQISQAARQISQAAQEYQQRLAVCTSAMLQKMKTFIAGRFLVDKQL